MCPRDPKPFLIKTPCWRNTRVQKSSLHRLPWTPDLTSSQIQRTLTSIFQAFTGSVIPLLLRTIFLTITQITDPNSNTTQSSKLKLPPSIPSVLRDLTTKSTTKKETRGIVKVQEALLTPGLLHQLLINSVQPTLRASAANQGLFDTQVSQLLLSQQVMMMAT